MPQTIAEKVFSRKVGRRMTSGEYVSATPDQVMCHDGFLPAASKLLEHGIEEIWDPERVVVVLDHYVPASSGRMAEAHGRIRSLIEHFGIRHFHGERDGICHQVMIDNGYVRPGDLILGMDSHTCSYGALGAAGTGIGTSEMALVLATGDLWFRVPSSIRVELTGSLPPKVSAKDVCLGIAGRFGTDFANYRSIEFTGELAAQLSVASRVVLSNMAVEFGGKFGFFWADETTLAYLQALGIEGVESFRSDEGASFEEEYHLDASSLEPLIALPHSVANVKKVREVSGVPIQQAFLGSCSNGRVEDLRAAADILEGRSVARSVRLLVYPASRAVYRQAMEEGIAQILSDAGAILCAPVCGPCFGDHGGILAPGEACIASTNRNFKGRMGSPESDVYLASPATVAASAFMGAICDPREVS